MPDQELPAELAPSDPTPTHPNQLPCTTCGWWVTPGRHSEANCMRNQTENDGGLQFDG